MKRQILNIFAAACLIASTSFAVTSCRHASNTDTIEHPDVSDADLDPVDLENGPNAITVDQLNELILSADDLTPGKAVGALKMLDSNIRQSQGTKRDETMRKFVDLYGILLDIHGDNLRTAIKRLKNKSGVDLEAIYADYCATLNVGDEVGGDADFDDQTQETPEAEISTTNETPETVEPEKPATPEPSGSTPAASEPEATISTFGN